MSPFCKLVISSTKSVSANMDSALVKFSIRVPSPLEVTTSRLEEPAYSFGSNQITFEDVQSQTFNPLTGEPQIDHRYLAESQGNAVYVRGIPVFYWPRLATDLSKPSFFIDNIAVKGPEGSESP